MTTRTNSAILTVTI